MCCLNLACGPAFASSPVAWYLPSSKYHVLANSHDPWLQMEMLLISNDLLGTSGRPILSKTVCIGFLHLRDDFQIKILCCKNRMGKKKKCLPAIVIEFSSCSTELLGADFSSNKKKAKLPSGQEYLCNSHQVICWREILLIVQRSRKLDLGPKTSVTVISSTVFLMSDVLTFQILF